jgi:phage antirepressor YoqD-like protein
VNLITSEGNVPRVDSITIADGAGVTHHAVLQLIRTYQSDLERYGRVAFEMQTFATAGGTQQREVALLCERQATLLLSFMRNSEVVRTFKIKLVDEFYRMAQALQAPALPKSYGDALEQLLLTVRQNEQLTADLQDKTQELEIAQPKALHYDRTMSLGDSVSVNEAAKILNLKPTAFRLFLRNFGWLYKQGGRDVPCQDRVNAGYLMLKMSLYGPSARFTQKGVEAVASHIERFKAADGYRYTIIFG